MSIHPEAEELRSIATRLRKLGTTPYYSRELVLDGMALDDIADRLDEAARPLTRREMEAQDGPLVRLVRRMFG